MENFSSKQPLSLQIAGTLEGIIEQNILPQAGNIRGKDGLNGHYDDSISRMN